VIPKAFVSVDKKGTEAATAVIMRLRGAPMSEINPTIDRPSTFIIRDLPSGQVLFVGQALNSTE
jgi:serine protease inhibitor